MSMDDDDGDGDGDGDDGDGGVTTQQRLNESGANGFQRERRAK